MEEKKQLQSEIKRLKRDIKSLETKIPKAAKALEPHLVEVARQLNRWHRKLVSTKDEIEAADQIAMPLARDLGKKKFDLNVKREELKKLLKKLTELK